MELSLDIAAHEPAAVPFEHPSPRPVDLVHLRRYTFGDQALEHEILGLFVEQTPRTVQALKTAKNARDWKMAAHSLKGAARAVGAWRVARMAEQAERVVEADIEKRLGIIQRIEDAAAEAEAFIRAMTR